MQSHLLGEAKNADEAARTLRANLTPRARELDVLERYAKGTQYEGLADWFDPDKPLWERAPCIVYPIVGVAARSNVDLVLGEGRFPTITTNPGEDDGAADGLDPEQSKKVDRAITELCDAVRFRSVSRQALEHGQHTKSVAAIVGARAGKPFVELVRSRWCEPTFDLEGNVATLEIRYPYVEWKKELDGTWILKPLLYRRTIDAESDVTYLPVDADKSGREPPPSAWSKDPERTVKHGLGFCPVHWYACMKECTTVADYDGTAIHENVLDEVRGLDFALSQRHRAALFCGDPQIVETGVEPGYNPSGEVGVEATLASAAGGVPSGKNPVTGSYRSTGAKVARKKSPGIVWQYEHPESKVAYLVLPPEALQPLDDHCADLRNKIAESMAVVILDPQNAKFTTDMSGKAVEQLRARQFDRCDQIRDDVADNWIRPVVRLLVRVALATELRLRAIEPVRDILTKFAQDDAAAPLLFVRWPSGYIKPDPDQENVIVAMCVAAKTGGIITRRMALEKLAAVFGIDNVDQAEEALDEERNSDASDLHDAMTAMGGDDGGPPGKAKRPGKPKAEAGGRSGAPPAQ